MSDHVYKTVEVTGSSPDVISAAIRSAIDKASQSLRNIEWFQVTDTRGVVADGKVAYFQVTLKIGFKLD
jgi:flavin-binding protein dodecin